MLSGLHLITVSFQKCYQLIHIFRVFLQSAVNRHFEQIAVRQFVFSTQPGIIAHTMLLRIFNDGQPMFRADLIG